MMVAGVYLVGFFPGCSFQFCLALIYLVCWMLILLWFYMRYFSLFALRTAIVSLLLGMAFLDWGSLIVWLLSILW
jgi:hypothetical protein